MLSETIQAEIDAAEADLAAATTAESTAIEAQRAAAANCEFREGHVQHMAASGARDSAAAARARIADAKSRLGIALQAETQVDE